MIELAQEKLKAVFGYSTFRPQQQAVVTHILEKKDTIVLMPTGGGKSICFQLPALLFEGTTLVVSPLISLMKDQVEALRSNGVSAAFYNSSIDDIEKQHIVQQAKKGAYKLLYMAPETLFTALNSWLSMVNIQLIAIDEAHCVSMWGHDFRPEYTQIHTLRSYWKDIPFVALTATADKATRKEIETKLGLISPKTFLSSFDRPNLKLNVRGNLPKQKKQLEVLDFIEARAGQSGIIYCLSRKETEEWSDYLVQNNVPCAHYHAGLTNDERAKIQEDFIHDRTPVITATIAFGMGIDKSNVRWVIHNNLPKNLEGYYQEIGRGGRDGLPTETILYYNMRDVKLLADFAQDSPHKNVLIEKLNRMLQYAESKTCRRKTLLSYFSENLEKNCGNCDVCLNPPKFFDGTVLAQKALSGMKRTDEKVGMNLLIQFLRGAKTAEIYSNNFQTLKTYGVGSELSNEQWHHYLVQLLNIGAIEIAYDDHFHLRSTEFGERILFGKQMVHLAHYEAENKKERNTEKRKSNKKEVDPTDALFESLRKLRKKIADEEAVPAYIIFSDATLQDMVNKMPSNRLQFLDVSGVGQQKMENYGDEFIKAIARFKDRQDGETTLEKTYRLYNSGLTIEQIAEERAMQPTTIYSHLAQLYSDGFSIDVYRFLDDNTLERIRKVVDTMEDLTAIKPIFEALNSEVDYGRIRLALAHFEKTSTP
jgi:ATP-dependent DNA helicase RecQ